MQKNNNFDTKSTISHSQKFIFSHKVFWRGHVLNKMYQKCTDNEVQYNTNEDMISLNSSMLPDCKLCIIILLAVPNINAHFK